MKLTALSDEIIVIGLNSIHFVNLSTAIKMWVNPAGAVVKGPIKSRLQQEKGQDEGIVIRSWVGMWACFPKNWHPLHLQTRSSASVKTASQKKPNLYAFPTKVLEAAWLPREPSWISYKIALPWTVETHFMMIPEAECLYKLSPTKA